MDAWLTAISTVGFPIACCVCLFWYVNTTMKEFQSKLSEQMSDIKETLIEVQVTNKQLNDVMTNMTALLQELIATKTVKDEEES